MCEVYKIFARDWEHMLDFSDQSIVELFNHESLGLPIQPLNGFAEGKKWLNVQVTMWKEDMEKGLLFLNELYSDSKFPHWWLDSVFRRRL